MPVIHEGLRAFVGQTAFEELGRKWWEAIAAPGRDKLAGMPDPPPLVNFDEAVKTRKRAGGHAEASHRCATLFHLANIAIRVGRKLRYDPETERFIGDEEANRFIDIPMRAPWHL